MRNFVDANMKQDVGVSGGREALFDFLVPERRLHDSLRTGVTSDPQLGERLERRAEPTVIEHNRVARDDPKALEPPLIALDACRPGQSDVRQPARPSCNCVSYVECMLDLDLLHGRERFEVIHDPATGVRGFIAVRGLDDAAVERLTRDATTRTAAILRDAEASVTTPWSVAAEHTRRRIAAARSHAVPAA
jgi:hypothetical protein